jgi:hypothetical protein
MYVKGTKSAKPTFGHISQSTTWLLWTTSMQKNSTWNLKIWNLGKKTPKQMIDGNKSINLPLCIHNLHTLMFIIKNSKWFFFSKLCFSKTFCAFLCFLVMQSSYHVLHNSNQFLNLEVNLKGYYNFIYFILKT